MYAQLAVPNLFAVAMLRCQQSGFTPRVAQEAMQVQTMPIRLTQVVTELTGLKAKIL